MRAFLLLCTFLSLAVLLPAQTDFFGYSLTGQSPNSVKTYVIAELTNETSFVSNKANLQEFEHASRQIGLFNLGVSYATQVFGLDTFNRIQINLDTVVGSGFTKNAFRFQTGLLYELWDRKQATLIRIGGSRFRAGGFSMALRQEVSLMRDGREFELVPAPAMDHSVFANVYIGVETGFDSGFSMSVEESGILQIVTDHLVRDVASGGLTFDEYKIIEGRLHESIQYQAPKNTGGSEWYILGLIKGQVYTRPLINIPVQFRLGAEFGLDLTRISKRNQSRFAISLGIGYLLY